MIEETSVRLLALNIGSSTLKAAVYDRGGSAGSDLVEAEQIEVPVIRDETADRRLQALLDKLAALSAPPGVTVHRLVHGAGFDRGVELSDEVVAALKKNASLAPLHQPAELSLVDAVRSRWPSARHGAAFDTTFHRTLAPWSRRLPIPAEWDAAGLRRYGFHGLAFASALRIVAATDRSVLSRRVVLAHLGGGCSLCSVVEGRSLDTTMSLTPLGGVLGQTRSGDLDPGLLIHVERTLGISSAEIEQRLEHDAGLAGIAGHRDMRTLIQASDADARLAVTQFLWRIAQAIAGMATASGGLDHLVFSGGIAHHAPAVREAIVERLAWLGLAMDLTRNERGELRIDAGHGPAIWNVAVDEQRELAESIEDWISA